jgi:hypothetical protein
MMHSSDETETYRAGTNVGNRGRCPLLKHVGEKVKRFFATISGSNPAVFHPAVHPGTSCSSVFWKKLQHR